MKYLITADIHGSYPALEQVLQHFESMHCDMLCILGDILNYGPRNSIPEGINPGKIADTLNSLKDKIIAVRGNCDSEVDQMLLDFPIMADYALLVDEGIRMCLTHGHLSPSEALPKWTGGVDIVVSGHTHLPHITPRTSNAPITACVGSPTFPKGGNPPTFIVWESPTLRLYTLQGEIISELNVANTLQANK